MSDTEQPELARLTVELLSAFVSNNTVSSDALPALIKATRSALAGDAGKPQVEEPEYKPAVSVEESLASRDQILSLIDGKPYKALKRHLANNGLTPEEYRKRYNLPATYPMVSQSYSEQRRAFAKASGLGGSGRAVKRAAPAAPKAAETSAPAPAKVGKATKAAPKKAASKPAPVAKAVTKASSKPSGKAAPAPQSAPAVEAPAAKVVNRPAPTSAANIAVAQEAKPEVKKAAATKTEPASKAPGKPSRRMARTPSSATSAAPASAPVASEPAVEAPAAKKRAVTKTAKAATPTAAKPKAAAAPKTNTKAPAPKKGRSKLGIKVPAADTPASAASAPSAPAEATTASNLADTKT